MAHWSVWDARLSRGIVILCAVSLLLVGCRSRTEPTPSAPSSEQAESTGNGAAETAPSNNLTANEILQRLLKTYRSAKSYRDEGIVRLTFRQQGETFGDSWPSAVTFVRPNKLALRAFQATVVSDGQTLRASIEDPETGNVDGQIVERPAPAKFQLSDLASDPLLYDVLSSRLRRQPIQLELLIESSGLASAFAGDVACRLLASDTFDDHRCHRIEVPSPGGPFVFWVDEDDFLLRKLDYPAAALVPDLAKDPSVRELSLCVELRGATLGGDISDSAFEFSVPTGAKRVRTFVVPPRPLPSQLFGRKPGSFYFTDLEGNRVGPDDWQGKIVVLACYHNNPQCQATLQQVSEAAKKMADQNNVVCLAVATDPTITSNGALQLALKAWNVDLPIVRDLEAFGDSVFKIVRQPTILVLDKEGRVQIFQVGGNPELANQLVAIVDRLANGEDLASEIVAQTEREREAYDKLIAAGGPEPTAVVEIPEAVIRKSSTPTKFLLSKLWENRDIKSPGNLLLAGDDADRLYAIEGWRTVVELDAEGKIVARHELPLPEAAAVTFLRTAKDAQGKHWFVAAAPLAPQFYVFDDQFTLQTEYPSPTEEPLQVVDLQLADLDEKVPGLEVVAGSVGLIGVHATSMEGNLLWRNRHFPNATSVSVTPANDVGSFGLLVTGESGGILPINRYGNEDAEITVANRPIARLFAARFAAPTQSQYLAVSADAQGKGIVVGLDAQLKEQWTYQLPAGVHQRPIEPIVSSHVLGGAGEWWLAGPDGSVHMIRADGQQHDSFSHGAVLTGIAAGKLNGRPVLIVATDAGVTAWEVASLNETSN